MPGRPEARRVLDRGLAILAPQCRMLVEVLEQHPVGAGGVAWHRPSQEPAAAARPGTPDLPIAAVDLAGLGHLVLVVSGAYSGTGAWFGGASSLGVYGALCVAFAASVLAALIVELASRRPGGFVTRTSTSIAGAAVVMLIAAIAVAPVAFG